MSRGLGDVYKRQIIKAGEIIKIIQKIKKPSYTQSQLRIWQANIENN